MTFRTRLSIVFGVIVVTFVAATVFTQWELLAVDQKSRSIANEYAPSIEQLAGGPHPKLGAAVAHDIELEASRSHDSALKIERAYGRARIVASLMSALCVAIAGLGAIGLRRAFRAHTDLEEEHAKLLEGRASELEAFAGRVAHDILSPLGVVSLALHAATARGLDDDARARMANRGSSAIKRIERLVTGLLGFAVAGAKPQEGSSADVADVIHDVSPELRTAAAAVGAELHVDVTATAKVACNAGVLTSIVSNLAHNAIKYIGDGATRRIDIRAAERGDVVRIEVEDTGPGLPPGLEAHVFEPYVQGNRTSAGIGLGLATVKRIATAHGGSVTVRSRSGVGSTFSVELPKAAHG